jgi:hypothetical protein
MKLHLGRRSMINAVKIEGSQLVGGDLSTMMNNPIREKEKEKDKKFVSKEYVPMRVCCVVNELSQFNNPDIHEIRNHCNEVGILFTTRVYNPFSFADDKNYIENLPAFHMYKHTSYIHTFYLTTNPIQYINESITAWQIRKVKKPSRLYRIFYFFKKLIRRRYV